MKSQFETLRALRPHVPDRVLADAFGMTRQNLHAKLGPRDKTPPGPPEPLHATEADIPAVLKAFRRRHKMTQEGAAQVLNVPVQTLRQWEQGERACSLPGLLLLVLHLINQKTKLDRAASK